MEIFNEGEIVGAILQNVRYNLSLRKKTKKKNITKSIQNRVFCSFWNIPLVVFDRS